MKLRVFRSDKGDCLLVTTKDKKRMLVDGGMGASFSAHVAPALAELKPKKLDVVYVSHTDEDHIAGILKLMDDIVAWRVHAFQKKSGNSAHKPPKVPQPPEVTELWHNAFHEVLKENAGEISEMLAETATALASAGPRFSAIAAQHQDLATSTQQAIMLVRRAGAEQLGLQVNRPAKGKLMLVRPGAKSFKLGSMSVRIVGPFEADLRQLRKEWNDWLSANKAALATIRAKAKKDEANLGNAAAAVLKARAEAFAPFANATLGAAVAAAATKTLGKRSEVTTPNLASLMLLVEEGTKSVLLTGDGHSDDCYRGLKQAKKLDAKGNLHVDVMKALHHGSEHDITEDFCDRVTADHYVFCGNGFMSNPELLVIETMVQRRLAGAGPKRPFKLWFNANPADKGAKFKKHMTAVQKLVTKLAKGSKGRMSFEFIPPSASFFDVL